MSAGEVFEECIHGELAEECLWCGAVADAWRIEALKEALSRAIARCHACGTCGPARCPECEADLAVLLKEDPS